MEITFAEMGFAPLVTEVSDNPSVDGYAGTLAGLPYHIDPIATPSAYGALLLAIESGEVTIVKYAVPVISIEQVKQQQISNLQQSYQNAISQPVPFKNAAGVTSTYAFGNTVTVGGSNAQQLLIEIISAGPAAWTAGVWFDTTGKAQPMTFGDLQGLAAAIEAMETPDEQKLMGLIAQVQAAESIEAVQAVVWP